MGYQNYKFSLNCFRLKVFIFRLVLVPSKAPSLNPTRFTLYSIVWLKLISTLIEVERLNESYDRVEIL